MSKHDYDKKEYIQLSEYKVIQLAIRAKNGSDFTALYNGDWKDKYSSQSEAGLSFCNLLAFWCGKNESQMDSIFHSSGLMRDKWNEMRGADTYGDKTIAEAVANGRVCIGKILPQHYCCL